jgi:TolB protein
MLKRVARLVALAGLLTYMVAGSFVSQPAFASFPGANGKLLMIDLNGVAGLYETDSTGANPQRLVSETVIAPSWSPDGQRIVYVRFADYQVHVMNADGTGDHQITSTSQTPREKYEATWSPDGLQLAFGAANNDFGLYIMNADGSDIHEIFTGYARNMSWSATNKIAFATDFVYQG